MKKHILATTGKFGLGLSVAFLMAPSLVSAEVSTNVSVVSNYLFRAVTQTDGATAVQGGLDYGHESGFYAGAWGSNVDFGDGTSYELDLYAGYSGTVEALGYDFGYVYYAYPDAPDDIDFGEVYGELSYGLISAGLAYTTNSDVSGNGLFVEGDIYYYASLDVPLEDDYSFGLVVGFYDFKDDKEASVGKASYGHVSGNVTKDAGDFGTFSVNLEYADIDASDALGSTNSDDPKFWLGWSKSF
ncbi:TorF family putative porin [Marinobacter gelidimuriae]|uniref:TorF family putative porin n=1 Tax=Marinobacter gelidimuriae TaxID=2739064 RepID=UPI00037DADFF|nr:TorF family putative porin [Marinobacter gelidimuriae]